jgi:hypothetical protein
LAVAYTSNGCGSVMIKPDRNREARGDQPFEEMVLRRRGVSRGARHSDCDLSSARGVGPCAATAAESVAFMRPRLARIAQPEISSSDLGRP